VLDALGWERAHVVGHSVGGLVAQELALTARARVKSLVLMCTFARGKDAARFTPWIFGWIGSTLGAMGLMATESTFLRVASAAFFSYSMYATYRTRKELDKFFEELESEDSASDT
jgi:pimeloyl-ACP methyl ester carboxylesterase